MGSSNFLNALTRAKISFHVGFSSADEGTIRARHRRDGCICNRSERAGVSDRARYTSRRVACGNAANTLNNDCEKREKGEERKEKQRERASDLARIRRKNARYIIIDLALVALLSSIISTSLPLLCRTQTHFTFNANK